MTKHLFQLLALALLLFTAACKDEGDPAPRTVGISFVSEADSIDLNAASHTATVLINVDAAGLTKAELEQRLSLTYTSSTATEGKDFTIKSTEVLENPLQVKVEVEAQPSLARQPHVIEIGFDPSMQPMQVGQNASFELTIIPHSPPLAWYENKAYYFPHLYIYEDATASWKYIAAHFSSVPEDDYAVLGFQNLYVQDSGVGFFNMHRIYSEEIGSTNAKTAKINVPKALEFIPSSAGATTGTVKVIPQNVTVTRSDASTFTIGISGTGTYDLSTKVIDLVMDFDETAIGGPAKVSYTYKISSEKLSL